MPIVSPIRHYQNVYLHEQNDAIIIIKKNIYIIKISCEIIQVILSLELSLNSTTGKTVDFIHRLAIYLRLYYKQSFFLLFFCCCWSALFSVFMK